MSRRRVHATGPGRRTRALPAGLLGLTAALALAACGSSGKGLIPSANAGPLVGDFEAVQQAAENGGGSCSATEAVLLKTEEDFRALPVTLDHGLRDNLRQGISNLRDRAHGTVLPAARVRNPHDGHDQNHDHDHHPHDAENHHHASPNHHHPSRDHHHPTGQWRRHSRAGRIPGLDRRRRQRRKSDRRRRTGGGWGGRRSRGPGSLEMNAVEIAGRYRLQDRLGFGGMSTVHLALDLRLERQVAVKLLAEHLADDPAFVSRFQREAQAAARLVHPNVVQVYDSGTDERTDQYFIVMEYIEGSSCAEILRDEGWVEVAEALSIIEQACEGLDYAHRHGVVHRDVKPGNLLRAREGQVKLADFGIAKATEQSSITQVGSVLGTAAYLAPEQARGEEAGPSADLYALGVVTYQLISGRLPYEASSLTELALKQQNEHPPKLDTLVAAVCPELSDAVAIALALDPRDRYTTAREMCRGPERGRPRDPPAREVPQDTGAAPHAGHQRPAGGAGTAVGAAVQQRSPRRGAPRQHRPRARARSASARAGAATVARGPLLLVVVLLISQRP